MARAFIELVGDYLSAHKALTATEADLASLAGTADKVSTSVGTATSSMTADLGALQIKAAESAKAQVASGERVIASLEAQMAAYKELYATASTSQQGILASSFASRSKRYARLTGTEALGITGLPLAASGGVAAEEQAALKARRAQEREVSQFLRGGAKGAGGLGGLGFAALAGTSFVGAYAGAAALKALISAASEAQATEKLLAQATKSAGETFAAWKPQIDQVSQSLSDQTGFSADQVKQGLVPLIRATGSVTEALKLSSLAADIARGRNIDYNTSALLISKVVNGNVGLFKRYGVAVQAGATPLQALAAAQQKYAGAAEAYGKSSAGSFARFHAAIHNAEVTIGNALLPMVARAAKGFADWMDKMQRSGRLEHDVNSVTRELGGAFHLLHSALGPVVTDFGELINASQKLDSAWRNLHPPSWLGLSSTQTGGASGGLGHFLGGVLKTLIEPGYGLHQFLNAVGADSGGHRGGGAAGRARAQRLAAIRAAQAAGVSAIGAIPPGATLDQFKLTNLPQSIQERLASARTPGQKLAADSEAAAAIEKLLHTKGALSAAARVEAEKQLQALNAKIAEIKKQEVAASKANASAAVSAVHKDELLARARLELAQGNTAAANRLLRTDKARLEQELAQAKTSAERLAIMNQLTTVENAMKAKDAGFTESMKLQVAQARADALAALGGQSPTKLQIKLAHELKDAAMKAIHSHQTTMQGLIDAWNAVAQANSVLAQAQGSVNTYHAVSARAIVGAVAGLTQAQQVQLRARIAQSQAHRGHRPRGTAAEGQDIHVTIHADTNQTVSSVDKHHRRRHQRAGGRR